MQPIRWSSRSSCPAVLTARPTRSLTFCVQRSKGQRTLPIPLMPHISRPHRLECSRQSSWGLLSISPLRAKQNWAASGIWIWSTSQWWPAAPASANTIGSEVAYEAFYAVAATTTPQRAGRDYFLRLLFCGRRNDAHFLSSVVCLGADHLHQHPKRR